MNFWSDGMGAFVGIATMIVVLAIIAVVVSKNSQTSTVVGSIGTAFSGAIQAAVAPVGSGSQGNPGLFGSANPFG